MNPGPRSDSKIKIELHYCIDNQWKKSGKDRDSVKVEMVWMVNQQIARVKRSRIWGGAFLCWLFLMFATPKIPLSPHHHLFADMRNFFGVPNTLNVITIFPFLIVGVMGFVICLQGSFFNISFRGEVWGWALFYAGIAAVAFGSAYYHLKPDDDRVMWDTLPMMIAFSSLFSCFLVERVGMRIGLSCLIALVSVAFLSMNYARLAYRFQILYFSQRLTARNSFVLKYSLFSAECGLLVGCRTFNDFRLCMTFQLIPCIAIPGLTLLFPPKYTHSRYWLYAAGVHLVAKFEAVADRKIYRANHYIISGHSLEHLCSVMVPILLTVMLLYRNTRFQRLGDHKDRP